jgi:hypothetical protein
VRESIEAMKEIWTKERAEYHGEFVNFDPMIARRSSFGVGKIQYVLWGALIVADIMLGLLGCYGSIGSASPPAK